MSQGKIPSICIGFILMTAINGAYALDLNLPKDIELPDMGDPSSSVMSTSSERMLGLQLYRELRNRRKVIEDPELHGWIRSLGNQLVASAPGATGNFYFLIIDDPSMNAFAMPGGVIAVHSGLILQSTNENELAAVLSHEIAHVTQRHIARRMEDSRRKALVSGLGALAGAVAATQNPDIGQAVMTSSLAAREQTRLNFSRQAETEADRVGMSIMQRAGYDVAGMAVFMEKLDRQRSGRYQDIGKYLSTHPLSIDRLSDIKSRLPKNSQGRKTSLDYQYARAKLNALTQTTFRNRAFDHQGVANNYFKAWKAAIINDHQQVISLLAGKANRKQEAILLANAYNGLAKPETVIRLLLPFIKSYPGEEGLIIPLADAYAQTGQVAKAWQLMRGVNVSEQTSLRFLEAKQAIASRSGNTGEALLSVAERYVRLGEYQQAKSTLEQAINHQGVVSSDMARMQWLLKNVEKMLKDS